MKTISLPFASAAAGLVMMTTPVVAQGWGWNEPPRPPRGIGFERPYIGDRQPARGPAFGHRPYYDERVTREELPPVQVIPPREQLKAAAACDESLRDRFCIPKPEIVSKPDIAEGQIIISDDEKFLYLGIGNYMMVGPAQAVRYKVATAQPHEKMPRGEYILSTKRGDRTPDGQSLTGMSKNPRWCPTDNIAMQRGLPKGWCMPGNDKKNPFGGVAFYLAYTNDKGEEVQTLFRMHGTIQPDKIGEDVSAGCVRMYTPDANDLYTRVEEMRARGVVIKIHVPQGPTREEYARTQKIISANIQARYGYRYEEPDDYYRPPRRAQPNFLEQLFRF